ncbi:FAD-binding oxidoreductase (plasmid) [Asticcacaulis sp. DW145]|uniref:NAD(P)/FAD-dependent oxidoreductase n=1 Tax=Asticcacaulis sp. DW145 TaxID=3095608 RepID=UPI00308923F0|nr:FAD-binding oxidoreductase [Asticcacaulis sp. DW145]
MFETPQKLWSGAPAWSARAGAVTTTFLTSGISADVVIVGAGITGALLASALSEAGLEVVIIDQRPPLQGSIRASTALLQYDLDQPLLKLTAQIGCDSAVQAWQRSRLALDSLYGRINRLGIECDLRHRPSLLLAGNLLSAAEMDDEVRLRRAAGLYCSLLSSEALSSEFEFRHTAAIHCQGNFTADPILLTLGFLAHAQSLGAQIVAPEKVVEVVPGNRVLVKTSSFDVSCRYVVYATGYHVDPELLPENSSLVGTYVMVTKPQPERLWRHESLIAEASSPYFYARTTSDGRIMCGGEDEIWHGKDHCEAKLSAKTKVLEEKLSQLFPQADATAETSWCGAFGNSVTGLPTIGPIPGRQNCYGVFAFGGNGITFAAMAADLITARLTGVTCPNDSLFGYTIRR